MTAINPSRPSRRDVLKHAVAGGAALGLGAVLPSCAPVPVIPPSGWILTAALGFEDVRFVLAVDYDVPADQTLPDNLALYKTADGTLAWIELLAARTGQIRIPISLAGVDPAQQYEIAFVNDDGQRPAGSPTATFDAPALPWVG